MGVSHWVIEDAPRGGGRLRSPVAALDLCRSAYLAGRPSDKAGRLRVTVDGPDEHRGWADPALPEDGAAAAPTPLPPPPEGSGNAPAGPQALGA